MTEWIAQCNCGAVRFEATGSPIVSSACYCRDCQAAGHALERLPGAPRLLLDDGGTPVVLIRRDRIAVARGEDLLREYRLNDQTPTRRLVASCCNTPMAVDFTRGFWLSVYADRLGPAAPALEMRVMVRRRPQGVSLPGDVPNYEGLPAQFMFRLASAWIAMGFRRAAWPSYPAIAAPIEPRQHA